MTYKQYRRTQIAEMADWEPGFDMIGVSVSAVDADAGSPKEGDKIARNPANHDDRWLVAAAYFSANFEPLGPAHSVFCIYCEQKQDESDDFCPDGASGHLWVKWASV